MFQDALRKRKEDEDRVAQQNEFLNRSLRGSKKLRELEHEPPETGIVNDGFSSEHDEDGIAAAVEEPQEPYEPIYRVVGEYMLYSTPKVEIALILFWYTTDDGTTG